MSTISDGGRQIMPDTASKMPARIWATCNGMSTRLPDGHRQFIGGWSEDKDRPRAEAFIRADIVERMAKDAIKVVASLASATSLLERAPGASKAAPSNKIFAVMLDDYRRALDEARTALNSYREASNVEA